MIGGARPAGRPELERIARSIRRKTLEMVFRAQSGHLGGSFSAAEILACLYFREMRLDPEHPSWPGRDRFVPSKGHCAPALYAALSLRGVLPRVALDDLRQLGAVCQGHPCMNAVPGVDFSTGSLGHGLSIGLGMALGVCRGGDFMSMSCSAMASSMRVRTGRRPWPRPSSEWPI